MNNLTHSCHKQDIVSKPQVPGTRRKKKKKKKKKKIAKIEKSPQSRAHLHPGRFFTGQTSPQHKSWNENFLAPPQKNQKNSPSSKHKLSEHNDFVHLSMRLFQNNQS
jgi:hypothetical protein